MKALRISGAELRSGILLKFRRYDGKITTIVRNDDGTFGIYVDDVCITNINGDTRLIEAIRTADCF